MAAIDRQNAIRAYRRLGPLQLLPIRDTNFDAKNAEENNRRLATWAEELGRATTDLTGKTGTSALEVLARLLGGQLFQGTVSQSAATDDTGDSAFAHSLRRIPKLLLMSWHLDGHAGNDLRGLAAGGVAPNANFTPWTDAKVYVRAKTTTGTYAFIVI